MIICAEARFLPAETWLLLFFDLTLVRFDTAPLLW
jgi:hypothetical protein